MAFELLVIEGRDSGRRYLVDERHVPIGRGKFAGSAGGGIVLSDPTVSAEQAVIHLTPGGPMIEHGARATNETLVNGAPIRRRSLAAGDRIQMGTVVLEFRTYRSEDSAPSSERTVLSRREPWGILHLTSGGQVPARREFTLHGERISIGRGRGCDVEVSNPCVSRLHASLVWQGDRLLLEPSSQTNSTSVNGHPIGGRIELTGDEEIGLSDAICFRLELRKVYARVDQEPSADAAPTLSGQPEEPGLLTSLHASVARAQQPGSNVAESERLRAEEIDGRFGRTGAFLDIDVVDSYGMKALSSRSDHIIVSFDRFRSFVRALIEKFDGEFLNSNGDEVMSFFGSPLQAVRAASAVIVRLENFNRDENLLDSPFRVRQGVHTGRTLIDWKRGVAYSPNLDVAGHLQKDAETDGLLISQQTLEALPEGLPFERKGQLAREGIPTYRLVARIP